MLFTHGAKTIKIKLYVPTENGSYIYEHDGINAPAIHSAVRINPDNGEIFIVLSSGDVNLASKLGYHWTLWQTGYPDFSLSKEPFIFLWVYSLLDYY
ncbi:hypothetical protein Misp06_00554 [Microbulbifer sp. NBRC 101763]